MYVYAYRTTGILSTGNGSFVNGLGFWSSLALAVSWLVGAFSWYSDTLYK